MPPLFVTWVSFPAAQCENNHSQHETRHAGRRGDYLQTGLYWKREGVRVSKTHTANSILPALKTCSSHKHRQHMLRDNTAIYIAITKRVTTFCLDREPKHPGIMFTSIQKNMLPRWQAVITYCGMWFGLSNTRQVSGQRPGVKDIFGGSAVIMVRLWHAARKWRVERSWNKPALACCTL